MYRHHLSLGLTVALGLGATQAARPAQCPPTANEASLERQMFDLVNDARADKAYRQETGGVAPPLLWNGQLATMARCHSEDMIARRYFAHAAPDGEDLTARLRQAAIAWTASGENIAMADTVAQAERMFLDEPPGQQNHRGNILNREFAEVGIGIAVGAGDQLYITQDFLRP